MKKYFTISQFAKLRNININSLRYYEKIGLLKPAYVNPQTKYRYYSAEQLSELDIITLCINLGIPLKSLETYIDENNQFQHRKLLEDGRKSAYKRINDIQTGLNKIERLLDFLDSSREYSNNSGVYERKIPERHIFISETPMKSDDLEKITSDFLHLYESAQNSNLSPVFPAGIMINFDSTGNITYYPFIEVACAEEKNSRIIKIPEDNYLCMQTDFQSAFEISEMIESNFGICRNVTIIASNMFLDKFQLGSKPGELQKIPLLLPHI